MVRRAEREPTRWVALALVAAGGLVGSIPWWYANAHTSFASIRSSSFPANAGATYGGGSPSSSTTCCRCSSVCAPC